MEQRYITENKEAIETIIQAMIPTFKENDLLQKTAPIQSEQVVVIKKKNKLYRYGISLTQEGEKYVHKNILTLKKYLAKKYQLDGFAAEKEATDIMCLYILKDVFKQSNLVFNSNYTRYREKKDLYTLLKGITFIVLVLALVLFYILRG